MHSVCDFNRVDDDTLKCLIDYPEGTVGWNQIFDLLKKLNALCKVGGYGGAPQYAQWIREIWYDPDKVEIFRQEMLERRKTMMAIDRRTK